MREFIDIDFTPLAESRFASKAKTLEYYRIGLKNLREFEPLANSLLDAITGDKIATFIAKRRRAGLAIASINRQLEVLRRMLKLAVEWGKVEKLLPKVENRYLAAASAQSFLLRDATTILLDCALRRSNVKSGRAWNRTNTNSAGRRTSCATLTALERIYFCSPT